jgi:hypothetical protein
MSDGYHKSVQNPMHTKCTHRSTLSVPISKLDKCDVCKSKREKATTGGDWAERSGEDCITQRQAVEHTKHSPNTIRRPNQCDQSGIGGSVWQISLLGRDINAELYRRVTHVNRVDLGVKHAELKANEVSRRSDTIMNVETGG